MEKIVEKLSSYNLLNYLLSGVVMCFFMKAYWKVDILNNNIIENVFIYYFIGVVISRIGSLIIEPVLIKCNCIVYVSYEKYIMACIEDEKLDVMSESNNTYRTLVAMLCVLLFGKVFLYFCKEFWIIDVLKEEFLIVGLIFLFACAYRKQTKYIKNRVEKHCK